MYFPRRFYYINAEDPTSYATPDVQPVHFWSKRADIVTLRKQFALQWFLASIELWILMFIMSTLYLGSGHNPNRYTTNLDVAIVDFDGDLAGQYFLNAFRQSGPGNLTLHWRYKDPGDYNNNVDNPQHDVENGYVWASVVLRPNTTSYIDESLSAFLNASTLVTSPFAFTLPIIVTYEDGRNSFTVDNYVVPAIRTALSIASAQYGQMLRKEFIDSLSSSSNSSSNRSLQLYNALQLESLLSAPLSAQYRNLYPAFPYIGQLATTLGYIYLYLISGLIVGGTIKFLSPFGKMI
jgi:hypothetical protein